MDAEPCPYAHDKVHAVRTALQSSIVSQNYAIANITDAIASWSDDIDDGRHRPLVLIFTGPTGTGKSETAQTLAQALLVSSTQLEGSKKQFPEGLLELRGEDFVDRSNITKIQNRVRDAVAGELYRCQGHVVLVFDEAQKAAREALAVLSPLLQGKRAKLHHPDFSEPLDASRMVIIIISDIGVAEIEEFVQAEVSAMAASTTSPASPSAANGYNPALDFAYLQRRLVVKMRKVLTSEFKPSSQDVGLDLGGLADSIISFMPFNGTGAIALIDRELHRLDSMKVIRTYVDHLTWDSAVPAYLSLPKYLEYNTDLLAANGKSVGQNQCTQDLKRVMEQRRANAAAAGAANKGSTAPGDTAASVAADGSTSIPATPARPIDTASAASTVTVCGEPCDMPRSCMVRQGGRAIAWHETGPVLRLLKVLKTVLRQYPRERLGPLGRARQSAADSDSAKRDASGSNVPPGSAGTKRERKEQRADSKYSSPAAALWGKTMEFVSSTADQAIHLATGHHHRHQEGRAGAPPGRLPEGSTADDDAATPAVSLHIDVDCNAGGLDGTCRLQGVGFRFTRCLSYHGGHHHRRHSAGGQRDSGKAAGATSAHSDSAELDCEIIYEGDI